jgi:hypothetical protein
MLDWDAILASVHSFFKLGFDLGLLTLENLERVLA